MEELTTKRSYQSIYKLLSWLFILGVFCVLIASYWSLTYYPRVFIDEPWYSNAAWNLVIGEGLTDSMSPGILDRAIEYTARWPLLGALPYATAFKFIGLGLFQGRLASWIIGISLLIGVYLFSRQFYNPTTAALATLLLSLSWPFIQASHYIRPDITLAFFVILALICYLTGYLHQKRWAFFVAGLLIGLSIDVHPNGLFFAISLGLMHIVIFRKKLFNNPATWLFTGGAALAALYYFGYRYGFNFKVALQLSPLEAKILPSPIAGFNPVMMIKALYWEFGRLNAYDHVLDFVLIGAALAFIIGRRNRVDRFLLGFLGIAFVLMALLTGNKNQIYTILYYPILTIFIAEAFIETMREKKVFSQEGLFLGGLLMFSLAVFVILFARPAADARSYDYYRTSNAIDEVIPPGARVVGMPNWWLGLQDVKFQSILGITYLHFLDGKTLTEALDTLRAEYLIVDPSIRSRLVDQGYFSPGSFDAYKMPRQEFTGYLQANAEKILEYEDPIDGIIEVYRIDK